MANFYMMVGLPGSGKTTFAHNIEKGAVVISSDIIRKELWGSEEKQGDNKIVFEELEKRAYDALKQIEEKNYDAELLAQGIPADRIRHYGFAFEGKKVLIGQESREA